MSASDIISLLGLPFVWIWGVIMTIWRAIRCAWVDSFKLDRAVRVIAAEILPNGLKETKPRLLVHLTVVNASIHPVSFEYKSGSFFDDRSVQLSGKHEILASPPICPRFGVAEIVVTVWIDKAEAEEMLTRHERGMGRCVVLNGGTVSIEILRRRPKASKGPELHLPSEMRFNTTKDWRAEISWAHPGEETIWTGDPPRTTTQ